MKVTPIDGPLPNEHIQATSPVMRPETVDADARLRLNFWAGRSLSGTALELEQKHRADRMVWRGRVATPGIVTGLEVALEHLEPPPAPAPAPGPLDPSRYFVHVLPGQGFLASGEDIVVPRPLRVPLENVPVHYLRVGGSNRALPAEARLPDVTASRRVSAGWFVFDVDDLPGVPMPWAAVLLLCPAEFDTFARVDPTDPCDLDPSRDAFADQRRVDSCVLRLCRLPVRIESRPDLANLNDPQWRNRLANALFEDDLLVPLRQHLRRRDTPEGPRWDTVLAGAELLRWELLGVPLALLSAEGVGAERHFFLDRASMARAGGLAKFRSRPAARLTTSADEGDIALSSPGAGAPLTWRARVDQLAEEIGAFATSTEDDIVALRDRFRFVPPAGFLPRSSLRFLTSAQALALHGRSDQPPDRAGVNHFFPDSFTVEAVPVAVEDLDAALAASASLAPYDFSVGGDAVRVLVPIPQRVFDPQALVVEVEDPVFAQAVARFVAARQDWRQRRDFVRGRRDALKEITNGKPPVVPAPPLEPDQVEPEPTETAASLGFTAAWNSPTDTPGPWDLRVTLAAARAVTAASTLFARLKVDQDATPSRIEIRWRTAQDERVFVWTEPPLPPLEQADQAGQPLATPLWRRFTATGAQLGLRGAVTQITLHVEGGRVALATAGEMRFDERIGDLGEVMWWRAEDTGPPPEFSGGDWTKIPVGALAGQLLAPFEARYEPVFPDERPQADRLKDVESALNPADITARTVTMSIAKDGLERVLTELDAEADEADDFIDAFFTRAQVNLYRIRKLVVGETAAQKLLVNPALATIAEQETANASAQELRSFVGAAKQRTVTAAAVNAALGITQAGDPGGGGGGERGRGGFAVVDVNPAIVAARVEVAARVLDRSTVDRVAAARAAAIADKGVVLQDIRGDRPETGPTLPPRGLSIGQRFVEPPATKNLSYARAALREFLTRLPGLRLPLIGDVLAADGKTAVRLADLQGRSPQRDGKTTDTLREEAVAKLIAVDRVTTDTDEAEVTLAALDFTEIKAATLRTMEALVERRRAAIQNGLETLALIAAQRDAAAARVLVIEGSLAEARHDVSVARALRQEEQQRVAAINDRRDSLIHDEVRFLAYVRPRTVDPVRRNLTYWKLDPAEAVATLPACLRRHDEPPAELSAYVQLFRHAPARWFTMLRPLIATLNTPGKLVALLDSARSAALSFASLDVTSAVRASAAAVQFTVLGAHQVIGTLRQKTTQIQIADVRDRAWTDLHRDAEDHAAVGDLLSERHGSRAVSAAAAAELDRIGQVATCLHAEFAAIAPAIRLAWIERFSQFDRPALLRDLTVLPQYGQIDRTTRRRLQEFVDWIFGRVDGSQGDAVNLMNDLVRLCLLLASHAPVNQIIAGHVPRPTLVRPGIQIPIRPLNPELVRVGMEFHVWQDARVVARGRVDDLKTGEVSARVEHVEAQTTTIDSTMRVQFVPVALSLIR